MLARRVRELTASVNADKGRLRGKDARIAELQAEVKAAVLRGDKLERAERKLQLQLEEARRGAAGIGRRRPPSPAAAEAAPAAVAATASPEKGFELRQEVQSLRQQLKMAHSALTKEIGSEVPLARVLAAGSGWMGRAEQISRLKLKLEQATVPAPEEQEEAQARQRGRELEAKRRRAADETARQLQAERDGHAETRSKLEGAKARSKTLGRDVKALRERLAASDGRVAAAEAEAAELKRKLVAAAKAHALFAADRASGDKLSTEISRLSGQCARKDEELRALQAQVSRLRQGQGQAQAPPSPRPPKSRGGSGRTRPPSAPHDAISRADALQQQKMLELAEALKARAEAAEGRAAAAEGRVAAEHARAMQLQRELEAVSGGPRPVSRRGREAAGAEAAKARAAALEGENEAVRATLRDVTAAKDEEIALLKDTMAQTRKVFAQALRARGDA